MAKDKKTEAKPAEQAPAGDGKPKKSGVQKFVSNLLITTIVVTVLSSILIFLGLTHVVGVIVAGLLPCLVANMVERSKRRLASKTVTSFNLAGIMPYFFKIGFSADPNYAAKELFSDPYVWLMIYGFAGFGWVIVQVIPQIVLLFLLIKADFTTKKLKSFQNELVKEWGDEIKG